MANVDGGDINYLSGGTSDSLTRVMVLHPIACGVAFIAFLISIGAGVVGSLAAALTAFVAWILVVIAMACDFTTFGIVRSHVNHDDSQSKARWGGAIWMLVAAFVLLMPAMMLLVGTCLSARRERRAGRERHAATKKKKEKRFGLF